MKRYAMILERLTPLFCRVVVVVAAVLLCCPAAALAGESAGQSGASQDGNASPQQIYLDPDTGEVIPPPDGGKGAQDKKPAAADDGQARREANTGPRAWKTKEGVQMLTPDPQSMPKEQAVHCPDGSLRIGHVGSGTGQSERQALCAERND